MKESRQTGTQGCDGNGGEVTFVAALPYAPSCAAILGCLVAIVYLEFSRETPAPRKKGAEIPLKRDVVTEIVCETSLRTRIKRDDWPIPHRVLVIPEDLIRLHKENRVAVLTALAEIVRDGRPWDAIAACAYAVGLEESEHAGAFCTDIAPDKIDQRTDGHLCTERENMIRIVNDVIANKRR